MITRTHYDTADCTSGAVYSDCEKYRYRLWRDWDASKPTVCFLMLNPSTATEEKNDPTIERCQVRAVRMGYGRLEIANLFPYRATDPDELPNVDAIGPEPEATNAILDAAKDARILICGWGNHKAAAPRARYVMSVLSVAMLEHRIHALKINQDGSPAHPLYLPYSLEPVRYP